MTKKELKKEAYKRIVKQQQSHQQTFDDLKDIKSFSREEIALEIAKIPSKAKIAQNQVLRILFIASLALIALLRMVTVLVGSGMSFNGPLLLLFVLLSFVVPVIGIVLVIQHKVDGIRFIGILFIIGLLRSAKDLQQFDPWMLVGLIPAVIAITLAFWLPERMKTAFTKKTVTEEKDGETIRRTEYVFADERVAGDTLLDAGIE